MTSQKVFNFNTIFESETEYNHVKSSVKESILEDYKSRKYPVKILIGTETVESTLGAVLINLLLGISFVESDIKIKKDDLYLESTVTQDSIEKYINYILHRFRENGDHDYQTIRKNIYMSLNEMSDISGELNALSGNSISYRDFVRLAVEDEIARDLFKPDIKAGAFNEIETQFNEYGNKLFSYFKNNTKTELYPFIASNTGVNKKQLTQCLSFVGLKPDMDGSVIPVVVKDNFLNGLSNLESYFINCKGTRKALTTNNRMTRRSGYLTRKLSLSNIDHYHDNNIKDCGTQHFVVYSVDNQKKLNQIIGRHYYDLTDGGAKTGELKTVTAFSNELIGKKIGLRSPVSCAGKHVCATCYGRELSEINKDVNTGLVAVLRLTEPLTQMLLSAKHLLSTKTDKIDWGEDFTEVFTVNMNSIYFDDIDCTISFKKPSTEDFDEDEGMYVINTISILISGNKKAVEYTSPVSLLVNPSLLPAEKMKDDDDEISISSKNINDDDFVFKYNVKNNELTKSLQQILDLIESNDHLGINNYNDLVNKFDDLLIENGLDHIKSVHIEMISAVLIKDAETHKPLDFSKKDLDSYVIDRVSRSVLDAPLAVALSFERIPDQLVDLNTYEKSETSMMDYLFR